jgi:serine/threonine-protein kinase
MPADPVDLTASQTRLGESPGTSAFDHGRFAPGMVLADRYRIIGLLGRGGMGEVYRADDLTLGQSVALKFLPERIDSNRAGLERLLSEVRTARQVSHPNVCRVHDVGEVGGRRFISMEYIDGEDLSVLLRRIGRLPADKGVEIARQLCAGLAASHERGVLHRDLKPANIMLDGRGRVRITDFGLATALQTDGQGAGELAGTPAYMAPEQLDGRPVAVQTDIYALGLVLHEIFTGKRFHNVTSLAQLRDRHADATSVDLSTSEALLDPAVARVIERCLDPDPRRRPASCALVAASLPGGDPLAAAIAAGETPSPHLVAAASVQGAISPRAAALLGTAFVALLILVAAGQWNPPEQFGITRSAEVLSAQTRDLLAGLGYAAPPVDTAAGFAYRYPDWRDASIAESDRPWSMLKARRPAAVYFWYREQPSPMAALDMGRIGLEALSLPLRGVAGVRPHDPPFEPGSIYVERGPDGSLDTLHVNPGPGPGRAGEDAAAFDWSRLFGAARLDPAAFRPATPEPALALPGDRRLAWVAESTTAAGPLRVEAAELDGRPVAFRVLSPHTPFELGITRFLVPAGPSTTATIAVYASLGFLGLAYLGAAYFMRHNVVLGRGDRRGAARLARVIGGLVFAASWLSASAAFDVRFFGTLHGAAAVGLFAGAWCWAFYMAIEPFVRRQWPRVLIGWSRLMAGEWRDPQVGREIFLGGLTSAATTAMFVVAGWITVRAGGEPPLTEEFHFRALGGIAELASGLLQVLPWAALISLLWMVLLLMFRRLLRSDLAAVVVLSVLSSGVAPTGQWAFAVVMIAGNVLGLMLALRVGFLSVVSLIVVGQTLTSLPVSPGTPGFVGGLSWIPIAAIAVPTLFGLYTALAGQSIFGEPDR